MDHATHTITLQHRSLVVLTPTNTVWPVYSCVVRATRTRPIANYTSFPFLLKLNVNCYGAIRCDMLRESLGLYWFLFHLRTNRSRCDRRRWGRRDANATRRRSERRRALLLLVGIDIFPFPDLAAVRPSFIYVVSTATAGTPFPSQQKMMAALFNSFPFLSYSLKSYLESIFLKNNLYLRSR
jgi:hypothetical protein